MSYEQRERYTGRMHESDYLGEPRHDSREYAAAYQALAPGENGYLPRAKAIELVKRFQPWDPTNPGKDVPRDLRIEVIDQLVEDGVITEQDADRVKYFTAVRTPLDTWHGADAFLEFDDPATGARIDVTLDITADPAKIAGERHSRADILFNDLPDAVEEPDAYLKAVSELAKQVVRKIEGVVSAH